MAKDLQQASRTELTLMKNAGTKFVTLRTFNQSRDSSTLFNQSGKKMNR